MGSEEQTNPADLQSEIQALKLELAGSRSREQALEKQLKLERERNINSFVKAEAEEERITNMLYQRLEQLKREKEALIREVEREEEMMTNTLQKQLLSLRKEKIDLENKLEQEQEYVVNKLHKQLRQLQLEKEALQSKLDSTNQELLHKVRHGISTLSSSHPSTITSSVASQGQSELLQQVASSVDALQLQQDEMSDSRESQIKLIKKLRDENQLLKEEVRVLRRRVVGSSPTHRMSSSSSDSLQPLRQSSLQSLDPSHSSPTSRKHSPESPPN